VTIPITWGWCWRCNNCPFIRGYIIFIEITILKERILFTSFFNYKLSASKNINLRQCFWAAHSSRTSSSWLLICFNFTPCLIFQIESMKLIQNFCICLSTKHIKTFLYNSTTMSTLWCWHTICLNAWPYVILEHKNNIKFLMLS
jgi:hypothetical protein